MMDQLGIQALRPGPSGNEQAPNHANYDESKANPYPNIPDPLTTQDGRKVTTADMWWKERRPEIVEMYSKYVYGRVPEHVPAVKWTVTAVDHETIGFTPVIAKDLIGEIGLRPGLLRQLSRSCSPKRVDAADEEARHRSDVIERPALAARRSNARR